MRTHCCGHIVAHDVSWAAQTGKHLLRTQNVSEQNKGGEIRDTKNPQLVAQHCFVASFGRCFPFSTVRNQLVAQRKHLLRVEEICSRSGKSTNQSAAFLRPETNVSVADQVDHAAAKYEIQKPSTWRATLFRCKFWSMFAVFHLAWSTWPATETFVASRRNAALWLVDLPELEQIGCAPSCEFDEKRATKPKFVAQSRPAFYFSQQLSSTRNKCSCCATSW